MLGQGEKQHFGYAETMQGNAPSTVDILFPLQRTVAVAIPVLPPLVDRPEPGVSVSRKIAVWLTEERAFGHDFLFVPVVIGCGAILWFSLDTAPSLPLLIVAFLVAAPLALLNRYRLDTVGRACSLVALLLLGMLFAELETRRAATILLDTPVTTTLTGKVVRREVDARGDWRYLVQLHSTEAPSLTRLPGRVSLLARWRRRHAHRRDHTRQGTALSTVRTGFAGIERLCLFILFPGHRRDRLFLSAAPGGGDGGPWGRGLAGDGRHVALSPACRHRRAHSHDDRRRCGCLRCIHRHR